MHSDRWVTNASPLIFLGAVDGIEWLVREAAQIIVPNAVIDELAAGAGGADVINRLRKIDRIQFAADVPVPPVIAAWDLGSGETQVLAQALLGGNATVVLDDLAARSCAQGVGLRVIGTLGIVLLAKRDGRIAAVRPIIERLLCQGMYLSSGLIAEMLQACGE